MIAPGQDEEHLRLLSIFHYVLGGLVALVACVPLLHVLIGVVILASPNAFGGGHGGPPPAIIGLFFLGLGGACVLGGWAVAGVLLYTGRCLARRTRHLFCQVVAGLSCLLFPLGTVLGVFTLIVLNRPSVRALFGPPGPPVLD